MQPDELEERERKLKLALLKGPAAKVDWPTVAVPSSGFGTRLPAPAGPSMSPPVEY